MTLRGVMMLLVSLLLAGVAALSASRWMASRLATGEGPELTKVVAAANEILPGTRIDFAMIKMVALPVASVPPHAFRDPQAVVGRFAAEALPKDDILSDVRVVAHLGTNALAGGLAEGMRAYPIQATEMSGIPSQIGPGDRVDLLAIRRLPDGSARSLTLLQTLKVLGVDPSPVPGKTEPGPVRSVTLEVAPRQAEAIAQATAEGKLQLILRGPLDQTRREPDPVVAPAAAGPSNDRSSAQARADKPTARPAVVVPTTERSWVERVPVIRGIPKVKDDRAIAREPREDLFPTSPAADPAGK